MGARAKYEGNGIGVTSAGGTAAAAISGVGIGSSTTAGGAEITVATTGVGCSTRPNSRPPANARNVNPTIRSVPASVKAGDRTCVSRRARGIFGTGREPFRRWPSELADAAASVLVDVWIRPACPVEDACVGETSRFLAAPAERHDHDAGSRGVVPRG
jgi:hypothetical protein